MKLHIAFQSECTGKKHAFRNCYSSTACFVGLINRLLYRSRRILFPLPSAPNAVTSNDRSGNTGTFSVFRISSFIFCRLTLPPPLQCNACFKYRKLPEIVYLIVQLPAARDFDQICCQLFKTSSSDRFSSTLPALKSIQWRFAS